MEKVEKSSSTIMTDNFNDVITLSKDEKSEENLEIKIDLENNPLTDDESIQEYTDSLADYIEETDFIDDGHTIDRAQLFGEIKLHVVAWKCSWVFFFAEEEIDDHANPANINIYSDGRVKDPRPTVNWASKWLSGGYYE